MFFTKNLTKIIGTNAIKVAKNLSGKYSQKPLDSAKKSKIGAVKTALKRAFQKMAEATVDLINNKIADKNNKCFKIFKGILFTK